MTFQVDLWKIKDFFKTIMGKYTSNKTKALSSLNKLKNILASESQETTEMLEIYRKYAAGEKVDKAAMDKANSQFTDLIKNVPENKINALIDHQSVKRLGVFEDVLNVVKFFIDPKSDFITGQIIYLGGIN